MFLGNDSEDYPVVQQSAYNLQPKMHLFSLDDRRQSQQTRVIGKLSDVVSLDTVVMIRLIDSEIDPL